MSTLPRPALRWIACGVFVAATTGVGTLDAAFPVRARKAGISEAMLAAHTEGAARLLDGSAARVIEAALRERSRTAALLEPAWGAVLYGLLRVAGSEAVLGDDGRLFPKAWFTLDHVDQQTLGAVAAVRSAAAARRFAALGVRVFVAPVPESPYLYADCLPRRMKSVDRSGLRRLLADLRLRGVDAIDLEPRLRAAAAAGTAVSLRTDTHWTPRGAALAAETVAAAIGRLSPDTARTTTLRAVGPLDDWGDLLRRGGMTAIDRSTFAGRIAAWCAPAPVEDLALFDAADRRVGPPEPTTPAEVVVVGTSFSRRFNTAFPADLAHFTQAPVRARALAGAGGFRPLSAAYAAERLSNDARIVVWESPSVALINVGAEETVAGDYFAECAPLNIGPLPGRMAESAVDGTRRLRAGALFHDGDGAVVFRIGGRCSAATVRSGGGFLLASEGSPLPGAVLPILDVHPTAGGAITAVTDLALVDAGTDVDLDAGTLARLAAPSASASGWEQVAEFPNDLLPAAHAEIVVTFDLPSGPTRDWSLRIEGVGGVVIERVLRGAAPDAMAFVNAGPLARGVRRVVLYGAGALPERGMATVALHPLSVRRR